MAVPFNLTRDLVRRRQVRSIERSHVAADPEAYRRIDSLVASYHSAGGIAHAYYRYSLVSLHRLLDDARPTSILELGSGGSTAVFAQYARANDARVLSLEEDQDWYAVTKDLVTPDATVRLVLSRRRVSTDDAMVTHIEYEYSLERQFDFVFVDGPSLRVQGKNQFHAVNTDVFRLLEDAPPKCIVVDKRPATVEALCAATEGSYDFEPSALLNGGRLHTGYPYFSVFRRRAAQ